MSYGTLSSVFGRALSFLYPFGATLNVAKPAVAVLSCGTASFPLNRPVCAFYSNEVSSASIVWSDWGFVRYSADSSLSRQKTGGRLVCLGSCHMFHDSYIDKEENSKIKVSFSFSFARSVIVCYVLRSIHFQDVIFQFLMTDDLKLNAIDSEDPEVIFLVFRYIGN